LAQLALRYELEAVHVTRGGRALFTYIDHQRARESLWVGATA
jgi:hypothetical protein